MASDTRRRGAAAANRSPLGASPEQAGPLAADGWERLERHLVDIRARWGDTVPVSEVVDVVRSLLDSLSGDPRADDLRLYHEVEKLGRYIRAAKAEVAALNPADIREDFLPTAADELDAIVQSTETATGQIMDAAERIDVIVDRLAADTAEPAAEVEGLRDVTTHIYEACSFQDITGQRITKVVRMLKSIEGRIDLLVRVFDPAGRAAASEAPAEGQGVQQAGNFGRSRAGAVGDRAEDDALLNGPQGDDAAMQQDDIDALLSRFD